MIFLDPKTAVTALAVNLLDLVASFPWPRRTPQFDFPIKSYHRLKFSWSDLGFNVSFFSSASFFPPLLVNHADVAGFYICINNLVIVCDQISALNQFI
jgi:hypothetical protein